jgi:5-(carboxyamino)imidazole ribonucleotide mutase
VAIIGVVMGSISDLSVMESTSTTLTELGIEHETSIISAHRMPVEMASYAQSAADRGLRVIIAGAGGAAHLPGMLAAHTLVPVLGVPVPSTTFQGTDSLLSIVQMPAGVPVATFAVGRAGAVNAALFAAAMLATTDADLLTRLTARREAAHAAAVASQAQLP